MARDFVKHLQNISGAKFENQVRRLIRTYFDLNSDISLNPRRIGNYEVDIVLPLEETKQIYLIEATKCQKKGYLEKKVKDLEAKNIELRRLYPGWTKFFWFVIENPTDLQNAVIEDHNNNPDSKFEIILHSYDALLEMAEKKDASSFENWYLNERIKHPFGSAKNPKTGPSEEICDIKKIEYMPCNIYSNNNEKVQIDEIVSNLKNKNLIFLSGEYGLGKSITLANIFLKIMNEYNNGENDYFPIFLELKTRNQVPNINKMTDLFNLHFTNLGNKNFTFTEILEKIGTEKCLLLLDGLDEISQSNENTIKDRLLFNSKNLEFLKFFLEKQKGRQGIIISVRSNFFFDFKTEIKQYLNLSFQQKEYCYYELQEFTQDESIDLFKKYGGNFPKELPPLKPLLISKLAISNIIDEKSVIKAFYDFVDFIIEREYHGHFAKANELTEKQFKLLIYEIISYTMTLRKYDSQIEDAVLNDLYNSVVKRNPTSEIERELKKLMIFKYNDNQTVSIYDEHISESIIIKIVIDICSLFFERRHSPPEKSYQIIVQQIIEQGNHSIGLMRKWIRTLHYRNEELFDYLTTIKLTPLNFRSLMRGLCQNELDQLAFIILNSYYSTTPECDLEFKDVQDITGLDTSNYEKFGDSVIRISGSIIEDVTIHSTRCCFIFEDCMIMNIKFKDNLLEYTEDINKYNLDKIFINCETTLRKKPEYTPLKQVLKRKYNTEKEKALIWCLKTAEKKGSINRMFFYSNHSDMRMKKKDIDWVLRKLISLGYFSTFIERGNVMYKKEKTIEIKNIIETNELSKELKSILKQ